MIIRIENVMVICVGVILYQIGRYRCEQWERIRCSSDPEQRLHEGTVAHIGRFPWLGVVQYSFMVGNVAHFAITPGVLVHPSYALAPAYDMARIAHDQILNNTKFILWYSEKLKYPIKVLDYILHPDYDVTSATVALLDLLVEGHTSSANPRAVLPVCLPLSGAGVFQDLYAVRMTDQNKQLQKEVFKMKFVDEKECTDFYTMHKLSQSNMSPVKGTYICAVSECLMPPCVWDGGVALITRQNWGFWKIVGFSVRGPGCGAPARFLLLHNYLQWIDEVVTQPEPGSGLYKIGVRRFSPIEQILYKASKGLPTDIGKCGRGVRGTTLYKDAVEITATKDFSQGFFYVIISQIAQFNCAVVKMVDITHRTNTAFWTEHYCHRDITGLAVGQGYPRDYRRQACFMYFKSAAFIQYRFVFSFKTSIQMTIYGEEQIPRFLPNPMLPPEITDPWVPTATIIKWDSFVPYARWYWDM